LSSRILSGLDIYEFGIARAELAQLSTYGAGIAFFAEELAPLVVSRPPAGTTVIPAGDRCIDP
jgi:hypothetical protein